MTKKPLHFLTRFIVLSLAGLMLLPAVIFADNNDNNMPPQYNNNNASGRLWNLQNADIQQVAAEVSRETGKNFLIDPRVSGKISIISTTPISGDEVYQMFLSMLQVLGYTIVPSGQVYKIIPASGSASQNIPIATRNNPGQGAEMVVRVIPIRNVSASKLVPILRPLIPDTGGISAYFPANTLIITSSADNISHLISVIQSLDQADTTHIEVIPLQNATASDVVSILTSMEPDSSDESHVTLAADEHTNSILISGDAQGRTKMRQLIARLDMPPPPGFEGNTRVFYLHYLKAAKIAPVLSKVAQSDSANAGSAKDGTTSHINIQAEPTTNSLIVTAPPAIMRNLQTVISQLDIRPAQVLVEAAIVEIDEGTLKQLGVQWGTINTESSSTSSSTSSSSNSGEVDTTGGANISRGTLPTGYNEGVGVIKSGNFREIITMLQQSQSTDILSTPSLVVLDNQTAKIDVGKTLSIQTGSYSSTDSTSTVEPFDTFDRQQIGLHLYVTPQINRGDAVQLKIDQGNETLQDPLNPTTTPVTNNSGIKTTVLVNTGDVLVLGGLISDNQQAGETKIPLVGDIPGIGKLFQYHTNTNVKKNLMVFLKPIILYDQQNSVDVTNGKYDFMRNQQIRWNNGDPIQPTNTLPQSSTVVTLPKPFAGPGMAGVK
ncbi:MAG: type II secretion system secretin GspD [Gammaproteobacteria bacterium]|nr:type II secretion system secretin GspD [Gammaproteobacteria bacterium]